MVLVDNNSNNNYQVDRQDAAKVFLPHHFFLLVLLSDASIQECGTICLSPIIVKRAKFLCTRLYIRKIRIYNIMSKMLGLIHQRGYF